MTVIKNAFLTSALIAIFLTVYFRIFLRDEYKDLLRPRTAGEAGVLPEEIEIKSEAFKILEALEQAYQLASSEAEGLEEKIKGAMDEIRKAQGRLKDLQQNAASRQKELERKTAEAARIPVERLEEYQPEEKDGKLVLMKRKQ